MGLFSRKPKDTRTDEYRESNRAKLSEFNVTKAWGIKKYSDAMQFIYDKEKSQFVVVTGPEDTFRDREPDVIDFEQVKGVTLEVDEYWTEGKSEFEPKPFNQNITQDRYKDVYWRYDMYLIIETEHPYAGTIRYKMNYKPTVMKIPQHGIFYRRGLEIGGKYSGEDIGILAARLGVFGEKEENYEYTQRMLDIFLTRNKGKGSLEVIKDGLVKSTENEIYYKKIANLGAHVKRASRISKLLNMNGD